MKRTADTGTGASPDSKKIVDTSEFISYRNVKDNVLQTKAYRSLNTNLYFNNVRTNLNDKYLNYCKVDCPDKSNVDIICSRKNDLISDTCFTSNILLHELEDKKITNNYNKNKLTLDENRQSSKPKDNTSIKNSTKLFSNGSNGHIESNSITFLSEKKQKEITEIVSQNKCEGMINSDIRKSMINLNGCSVTDNQSFPDDWIEDALNDEFFNFSPFKNDIGNKAPSMNKEIEKIISEGVDTLSFVAKRNYGRYIVYAVNRNIYKRELLLEIISPINKSKKACVLTGFWYETKVKEADIVHILFSDEQNNKFCISNDEGLIIINPDHLLSGTSVVSGVFCSRKSVLNEKYKNLHSNNKIMLIGSLVHRLFQQVMVTRPVNDDCIRPLVKSIIREPQNLMELYGLSLSDAEIEEEILKFSPSIISWVERYYSENPLDSRKNSGGESVKWLGKIKKIVDVEENIWSPRFGIKGKIDLTVENNKSDTMPLELKTGRSSFSAEHKGQLTLYNMMMSDRRVDDCQAGLLLYLRDGSMREINAGEREKKGLIQLRNDLVHYVSFKLEDQSNSGSLPPLPEPLNDARSCRDCSQLLTCCVMQKIHGETPDPPHAMSTLLPTTLAHLSEEHINYFRKWYLMLYLELSSSSNEHRLRSLWCHDPRTREMKGNCLSHMRMESEVKESGPSYFIHTFVRNTDAYDFSSCLSADLPSCFQLGDNVVISTDEEIALSTGVVTGFDLSSIRIGLERNLSLYRSSRLKSIHIDRCEFLNTMSLFFNNISHVLTNDDICGKLRRLIIENAKPEFERGMNRDTVNSIKSILSDLNKEQQRAVLRCLLSKDYSILQGFPGTGKTMTIVGLVRVLNVIGHSVLLASYTHSAVDNILLKLKAYSDVKFVRLGKISRIHSEILGYSDEIITQSFTTLRDLSDFFDNVNVVATTCLGINHPIFRRKRFDFCLIDEASQALEPACLGPLFFCSRFVLVGDPNQLPPVVKNESAKSLGMTKSLMERLSFVCDKGVCLTLQYRMNEQIMRLANHLSYDGKLQCANDQIKHATILHKNNLAISHSDWMSKCCSAKLKDAVVWLDARFEDASNASEGDKVVNRHEVDIVIQVVQEMTKLGMKLSEIGIITPYRDQVKLFREHSKTLRNERDSDSSLEINTVDQYQGRDKDVILFSCVRTNVKAEQVKEGEILNDLRRLNVAITRARKKLIMVGDRRSLGHYGPFGKLLEVISEDQMCVVEKRRDQCFP